MNTATVSNHYYGNKAAPIRWTVTRYTQKTFQAYPGAPVQAGGCCDKCGQGIRYVVTLKSTDGRVMDVGRDCAVTLEGGPELAEIRNAEAAYLREEYLKSPEYREKCERERVAREGRAERAARAEREHALLLHALRTIIAHPGTSAYEADRARRYLTAITEGAREAGEIWSSDVAPLAIAYTRATLPDSSHAGAVGEKIERLAMLEALIPISTIYGTNYIQKFRTADGELLVWFSGSLAWMTAAGMTSDDRGTWVRIKGTVKAHDTYQGEPQTKLLRCKITR